MNTKRNIIGEVEQMAVNAIVHQPDEKNAAEKHFSDVAKKIVETALQAVDVMEIGNVCRLALTGAAIQDYDLLANLLTDKDFDHDRLAKAIEDRLLARASEKPIDYPTYFTPGWLGEIAKWLKAGRAVSTKPPTDDELHEAATEEPIADAGRVGNVPGASRPGTVGGKGVDRGSSVFIAKTPQTVVFDVKLSSGRKLSAELEAESTEHQAQAFIYDGAKPVCQIRFFNQYQTRSYSFPIVRRALNGLMSKVGHGSRYRANRAAKAVAGASRPGESEVA